MNDNSDNDADDFDPTYEVGYGRPPKQRQFKKGRSGNPRGRPKGSKSFEGIVRKGIATSVAVKVDGVAKKMTFAEAIVARTLRDAAGGNRRSIEIILRLMERYGSAEEPEVEPFHLERLTFAEKVEMLRLLEKAGGEELLRELAISNETARAVQERLPGPSALEKDEDEDEDEGDED